MLYKNALELAQSISARDGCTQYVKATLSDAEHPATGEPYIAGYSVSDWYDDSVVARFDSGVRKDVM